MCEFLHNSCELGGSFARGRPCLAHTIQLSWNLLWGFEQHVLRHAFETDFDELVVVKRERIGWCSSKNNFKLSFVVPDQYCTEVLRDFVKWFSTYEFFTEHCAEICSCWMLDWRFWVHKPAVSGSFQTVVHGCGKPIQGQHEHQHKI